MKVLLVEGKEQMIRNFQIGVECCLLGLVLVCGCTDPDDPSVVARNRETLRQEGKLVGTLPDGRIVRRYEIDMGPNQYDHFVYVIDGSPVTTVNVHQGKTNSVHVLIDGVRYVPAEKILEGGVE